jgi:hypothetical protein
LINRDARRVAHNPNDVLSPYELYSILRKKAHPDQEYIFCHEMNTTTSNLLVSFDERFVGVRFDPRKRMGINAISNFAKVLNKRCHIPDWKLFTNHCWRAWMVTRLANDAGVSSQESLSFARHNSAASQLPYVRRGENSSASFQRAIQTIRYPSSHTLKNPNDSVIKKKKLTKAVPPTKSTQSARVSTRAGDRKKRESSSRMTTRSVSKK